MNTVTTINLKNDDTVTWSTDWESLIYQEIETKLAQPHIAQTYSYLIRSGFQKWGELNAAIAARYGKKGLLRIKTLAWKRIDGESNQ